MEIMKTALFLIALVTVSCSSSSTKKDPENYGPRDYFGGHRHGGRSTTHYVPKEFRGDVQERVDPPTQP